MDPLVFQKALDLVAALNRHHVAYKVVGGIAMIAQGVVRATEDIDIFVEPTATNIDQLKRALREVWDDAAIDEISFEDLAGDYPAVAYGPPDDSIGLDILTRLGEAFSYANIESETKTLGDVPIVVATPRMLVRMKRDTVRGKDRLDAANLRSLHGLEDEP